MPTPDCKPPLAAWFLGPRAENADLWRELLDRIFQDYVHWRRNYFPEDPLVVSRADRRSELHEGWVDHLVAELDGKLGKLKEHFPFHSPRYNAHMLSEQTLPSVLGYFAGMLYNPNNVTDEAAPVTVRLELEVGRMVASMLGYDPGKAWAHLCSGGTTATLEALWVARTVQFTPFAVRQYCADRADHDIAVAITTADRRTCDIRAASDDDLLFLPPITSIQLIDQLEHVVRALPSSNRRAVRSEIEEHLRQSDWNVARQGLPAVLSKLQVARKPKILVSETTHYSIDKVANVLGYGEAAVVRLPSNDRFQLDIEALREHLWELKSEDYVAAVVGIVGTTEEGAVDPVHEIIRIRDDFQREKNRSFWLHVDAAWGGYLRTAFISGDEPPEFASCPSGPDDLLQPTLGRLGDPIRAIDQSDSTTIDPHKLGYVPYPAGMVAFADKRLKTLIAQRAPYLAGARTETDSTEIDHGNASEGVGRYIIEGSKPGAAALACWLAHRTIRLDREGHGQLMLTTLRNARKLYDHIAGHRAAFERIHRAACKEEHDDAVAERRKCFDPFAFIPLHEPDTNIVCFIARPMVWGRTGLEPRLLPLQWINAFNKRIWRATSIDPAAHAPDDPRLSAQPFFVSTTELEERYSPESVAALLKRIAVKEEEYRRHGLFVLRSVVMNPWHERAANPGVDSDGIGGVDYIEAFVEHLHRAAADALVPVLKDAERDDRRRWAP